MNASTSEKHPPLSDPVPTKFFEFEQETLRDATKNTGLSRSEIIRRSVRLLGKQKELAGDYAFLLRLTA